MLTHSTGRRMLILLVSEGTLIERSIVRVIGGSLEDWTLSISTYSTAFSRPVRHHCITTQSVIQLTFFFNNRRPTNPLEFFFHYDDI
jgi:hypothetical protein